MKCIMCNKEGVTKKSIKMHNECFSKLYKLLVDSGVVIEDERTYMLPKSEVINNMMTMMEIMTFINNRFKKLNVTPRNPRVVNDILLVDNENDKNTYVVIAREFKVM